ncbi:MAG: AMP-binding protein [Halomonas sp.]|nr:AMP-binding protein [Halomonas sp.]MDN6298192.1 AMP-binding protein [Halomonas sp.]MDN6314987.1 AMP-binding protein [Halomonas sp.]MDN6336778.1 AMP-binding protein [Halomonas sp.]
MTYIPLTQRPWRRPSTENPTPEALPADWCRPAALGSAIDAWRRWLVDKPQGRWLLHNPAPEAFCAALFALWESGRSAVLPGDGRADTLAHLGQRLDGVMPEAIPHTPTASAPPAPQVLEAGAEALVLYTSGSTGEPLMQTKRFDQLDAELDVQASCWPLEGSVIVSQVSHQHIYGLLAGILRPVCHGVALCGGDGHYPEVMARRLAEARKAEVEVTLISSPAQLSRLPEHLDWPCPARIFSSGAPLAAEHARRAESLLGAPVVEIYGSTETGGIAWRRQASSADWTPLPGVEIQVQNARLELRSAFLEAPEQWWQQADLAEPVPGGFRLGGRADRLIKLAGKRVSLTAIERDLTALTHVTQAHCVRVTRQESQQEGRLGAIVVMEENALPHTHAERRALSEQLRRHLAPRHEAVALPRYWRFVAELPTNAQGKLDRQARERLFADLSDNRKPRWLGELNDGPNQRHVTLEVPERLAYLAGHFDDFPVVPGVVLVQWAIEQAAHGFGQSEGFQGVDRLKFQRPLAPGTRCRLTLERRRDSIHFALESREGRHAAGRLRFRHIATGEVSA